MCAQRRGRARQLGYGRQQIRRGCPEGLVARFIKALPALTQEKDVIARSGDMHGAIRELPSPGEVGSGKTVVAISAMLQAVQSGYQAVLVAPLTQVLAQQHHQNINAMLGSAGINVPVVLLTEACAWLNAERASPAKAACLL